MFFDEWKRQSMLRDKDMKEDHQALAKKLRNALDRKILFSSTVVKQ